ncbi:MAG: Ig-like domain-containing protein, partial [Cyclobacteriaceae bacterium]
RFSNSIQWWPNNDNLGGYWRIQNNGKYYYESDKDTLAPSTYTWSPASYGEEPTPGVAPNPILIYGEDFEFVRPTVTLSSTTPTNTSQSSIDVDIVFSELVQEFNASKIYLTNATLASLSGEGTNYTATISLEDEGEVKLRVSGTDDLIGNPQEDAEISFQYDQTAPTVVISTALGSSTPLTAFDLFLEFDEEVENYNPSLLKITNAEVLNATVQSSTKIKIRLQTIAQGTITAQLEAGAVTNLVGLENEASTVFSIVYDPLAPNYYRYDTLNTEYISDFLVTNDHEVFAVGNSIPDRSNDFTTLKFTEDGEKAWINREGGTGTDEAFQVVRYDNHLFVLGAITNESGTSEAAIYKYDYQGNEVDHFITNRSSAFANTLIINGHIYESYLKNDVGERRAISKISLSDFSVQLGEEAISTTNDVAPQRFIYDSLNDYIYFYLVDYSARPWQFVVGKYDLDLNKQWVRSFEPTNGADGLKDLKLDANGEPVVMGTDGSRNLYFSKLSKTDGSTLWETEVTPPNGGGATGSGSLFIVDGNIKYITALDGSTGDDDIAVGSLNSLGTSEFVVLTDLGAQQAFNDLSDATLNSEGDLIVSSEYFSSVNTLSVDKFDLTNGSLIDNIATYQGAFAEGVSAGKIFLKDQYIYAIANSTQGRNRTMEIVRFVDEDIYNSLNPVNTWTGTVDTDWGKSGNWSSGSVPIASDDVVISSTVNQPQISGDYHVNDISISASAVLTIGENGSLAIHGNASGEGTSRVENRVEGSGAYTMLGSTLDPVIFSEGANTPDFIYGFENNNYVIPTALEAGKGYFVSYAGATQSLELDGKLVSGSVSIDLTYSNDDIDNDYELLANPYNAAISHSKLVAANGVSGSGIVDGVIYLWRDGGANLANGTRDGAYETVLADGTTTGSFDGQLNRGEGFFVKSLANGSFQFTADMQGSASQARFMSNSVSSDLKLTLTNEKSSDVLIMKYLENATLAKDIGLDASKFMNPNLSFYTMLENERMAIQSLPLTKGSSTSLGIKSLDVGEYNIVVDHLPTYGSFTLIDRETNQTYLLDAKTKINVTLKKSVVENRLELVYEPNKVLASQLLSTKIQVFGTSKALQVQYAGDNEKVQIISISGKVIHEEEVSFVDKQAILDTKLKTNQVYILKINDASVKFLLK